MFLAYQEKPNINYVVVKCKFNRGTVEKYRKSERWDERLVEISQQAIIKADAKIVTKRLSTIEIVDNAIDVWAAQATGSLIVGCPYCGKQHEIPIPKMKAKFRDLAPFLVMKEQLGGGVPIEPRKHIVVLVRPGEIRNET